MITLTEEQKEKIQTIVKKNGARKTAIRIIDAHIRKYAGGLITSAELPDTAIYASGVDDVEDALSGEDFQGAYNIASETAQEMLLEEGFDLTQEEPPV